MSLEDVDEWMARRIPIPPLNDTLDDIECSSWIALIERELEGNTLSEALKISTHDEEKLGIYFFTDYVEDIFWALFLLGLYEVLQKPEFISESILSCIKQTYLSEIYTCERIQNEDLQACISNLQEIADTNISGQLSKDLITMKAKLASLQVLLPFYDVSSDKLETGIDLKATKGMFWQIKVSGEFIDLGF
ncbi:DUF3969 domain-containing protein, partial [Veillonella parvula]|nr:MULTISPECIES: DUF3969 domain-containing protein [Veillonella]MDU5451560.1 DUF3969 domain-containing protein [Veillonella sp.]